MRRRHARGHSRVDRPRREAALLQVVGGQAVMRSQLEYLADLARSGRVLLHVLPFGALGRPAPGLGSMSVLHVGVAPGITVVYLANASGGHFLTSPEATRTHYATFEQLRLFPRVIEVLHSATATRYSFPGYVAPTESYLMFHGCQGPPSV